MPAERGRSSEDSCRGLMAAVTVYVAVFAIKIGAYAFSGVMVMLAEALHTFSDILIAVFLLVAYRLSRRQADSMHMFGYGRAQNVAALIAATLFVSFTSYKLFEEALPRLWVVAPDASRNLPWAAATIVAAMLLSAVPLWTLLRQRARGAAAKAMLMELLNDELGLLAALMGIIGLANGWPLADPVATLAVAALIAFNGLGLLRENASLLLGRSPGPEFVVRISELAASVAGVQAVREVRAEYVGLDAIHAGVPLLSG